MVAPLSVKIGRIEGGGVGNGSVMLGVLRQSAKQAGERLGQQLAQVRSNTHGLHGLAGESPLPQRDRFIERHAQHHVAGFEAVDLGIEYLGFCLWKPRTPIVPDKLAASRGKADAVAHGRSPMGRFSKYSKKLPRSHYILHL